MNVNSTVLIATIPAPVSAQPAGEGSGTGFLGNSMFGTVLVVGGLMLAIFLLMRRTMRPRLRAADRLAPDERIEKLHGDAVRGREPIDALMVEAEQLTRRMAATLDNKAARLELLIERAERAIGRLEGRELIEGDRPSPPRSVTSAGGQGESWIDPPLDFGPEGPEANRHDAPIDAPVVRIAGGAAHEADPVAAPVRERVYLLADRGRSAREIADELRQPIGQVQLMLNLRV